MTAAPDPYRILGLARDATAAQIRSAFRQAVRRRHPDTTAQPDDGAAVRDVLAAYKLLTDPDARARYNADHPIDGGQIAGRPITVQRRTRASAPPPPVLTPCASCDGTGVSLTEANCSECRGLAEYTILDHRSAHVIRCRFCGGRGVVRVRQTCRTCGGGGAVEHPRG